MELTRRTDIEYELKKLGWTNGKYPGCSNIKVLETYNASNKPNHEKPWWITVFCKLPVWEWDFVSCCPRGHEINCRDYNAEESDYINNIRFDFEFESRQEAKSAARAIHEERNYEFDNDDFRNPAVFHEAAVQRVSERP